MLRCHQINEIKKYAGRRKMIMTETGSPQGGKQKPRKMIIKTQSRRAVSMLFPVMLIAAGVVILLSATGRLPDLNWSALLQLWPLLLIFIGLDIIVRLLPRPLGTILSFLLAIFAVLIFFGALIFADEIPLIGDLNLESAQEVVNEQISYPLDGVNKADITLNLGSRDTTLSSLANSDSLIEADVSYVGKLIFDVHTSDGLAIVELDTMESSDWTEWINPVRWVESAVGSSWKIGLASDVPTTLDLELGSGSAGLNLEDLTLSSLTIDGSSGHVDLALPGGDYDMFYDSGSGPVDIKLPSSGDHSFKFETGSGSVSFVLPDGVEAMVVIDNRGSGAVKLDDSLFQRIRNYGDGAGIWVTAGFEEATDRVELLLDTGSGSVSITSEN
jgi:hypothetical protein